MSNQHLHSTVDLRSVTEKEMAVAFAGPAIGANRFFITAGPYGVRIAFAEEAPETKENRFVSAVLLTPPDAAELARVLAGITDKLAPDNG